MHKILCVFPALFIAVISMAQPVPQFDSLFRAYHQAGLFNGTALIADSNGIVFHQSFGVASQETSLPVSNSTIFRLGSLEKQFTAMLTLQQVEKGLLKLDGKITDYMPDYRKETGSMVSIRHLLTHTSGIPNYTGLPNLWNDSMQQAYQPEYILSRFCSGNLEFTPGTRYKYGNTGYFILALILEKLTGKPLSVLLKENILDIAGMHSTGLDDGRTRIGNRAYGYYRVSGIWIPEPPVFPPNVKGAASIYSTAYDLYLWDRILYTNRLISSELMNMYRSPQFSIAPEYSYGFGWEFPKTKLLDGDTLQTMEHSGSIRAFRSLIFRIPSEKKCVILLSNNANESGYDLFTEILAIYNGDGWKMPRKLLADTMYSLMQRLTAGEAVKWYKHQKKFQPASYDFSSYALENLGERLMLLKQYEAAAAIFCLAVEEDPAYNYGWLYLGRSLERSGKIKEALEAYETAVIKGRDSRPGIDAAFQISYLRSLE